MEEDKSSNRRSFVRRLLGLGAAAGGATALLALKDLPKASADGETIHVGDELADTALSRTYISGSLNSVGVIEISNTSPTGSSAYGIIGASASSSGIGVMGRSSASSGAGIGVRGWSTSFGGIGVKGEVNKYSGIPLVAVGASGQTESLQEWQNSAGSTLSAIDKNGGLGIGITSPTRPIHLRGNNACFRMDRNADSAAFILVRTAPGNFNTVWKTFYVGVDASGVNNGEFFIGDNGTAVSGDSTRRLWIDNSGGVNIPNLITGDMTYANGVRSTEEGDGIAFYNPKGKKIAVLDNEGNLQVKGKITENPNL